MASCILEDVRVAGIAATVPASLRTIADVAELFGEDESHKIADLIGVSIRNVVTGEQCTSDLCEAAAERLLLELNWGHETIDALIFVSQTPDYILPATSCSLHGRLNLPKSCAALDINLGCSGYIYGLWTAAMMVANGLKRVLLLTGDTISRIVSPQDRSTAPLFGDAGTATALEFAPGSPQMYFELGTDGHGQSDLIVRAGGFRSPASPATSERTVRENGNVRSDADLFMDGPEIFGFTLREVTPLVQGTLRAAGWADPDVDAYVFHQANQFMLQHLAKRMKLPSEKVILALREFGNTSSASIPLSMVVGLAERLRAERMRLVLAGFGVGLSWGAVALQTDGCIIPELVVLSAGTASLGNGVSA